MNNIHPLFSKALAPFAPALAVKNSQVMRPFEVCIRADGKAERINVLADSTCDAICKAIELYFDEDESMPFAGLEIEARPIDSTPRAA